MNGSRFDWNSSVSIDFLLTSGKSGTAQSSKRTLENMRNAYGDRGAVEDLLKQDNPLIYEFYELGVPERRGDLAFGTTILYPGRIGSEYYMTKGHYHNVLETAEVYFTVHGEGIMLMENPEGDWLAEPMKAQAALYVPRRYAHRMINTGSEPLITFFVFDATAGHNYGDIERQGFRKLVVCGPDGPQVVDNPRWKGGKS